MKKIAKFIINYLWKQYCRDTNVLYAREPIGGTILSVEGFFLWIRDMHPKLKAKKN